MKRLRFVRCAYRWTTQFCDPRRLAGGLRGMFWYWRDYGVYRRMPGAEPMSLLDSCPALHERHSSHELDAHYFYVNAWAMRRIVAARPARHVDIASQTVLAGLLSAVVPVTYVDYRPLQVSLSGLECAPGNILALPYASDSIESLSCLHVAEHIGLGRYGDPLDPKGTAKAARELQRVLAPGGELYFALPVGTPQLCFNAHRIHSAQMILDYFTGLTLLEYSGVHDDGRFVERVGLEEFAGSKYACGMFRFHKPRSGDGSKGTSGMGQDSEVKR